MTLQTTCREAFATVMESSSTNAFTLRTKSDITMKQAKLTAAAEMSSAPFSHRPKANETAIGVTARVANRNTTFSLNVLSCMRIS